MSEARKYKLNLTIAHQYVEQMEEEVKAAIFGNIGTMIIFRLGSYDAEIFEKEFSPQFTMDDIVNLGFAQVYLKLMIDGISSTPFSARTLLPIAKPLISYKPEIIEMSRKQFTRPRREVEKEIMDWHQPLDKKPVQNEKPALKKPRQDNNRIRLNSLQGKKNFKTIGNIKTEKKISSDRTQLREALSKAIQNTQGNSGDEMKKVLNVPTAKINTWRTEHPARPINSGGEKKEIPKNVLEKMLYVKRPENK